jgi:integrase
MADERTLEKYLRGRIWWIRGTRPDTGEYIRESLDTPVEAIAETKLEEVWSEARKRGVLGSLAPKPQDILTFNDLVLLYEAAAADAAYLLPITKRIGRKLVSELTPEYIRRLARELYPYASTDTWQRQVMTPVRSVINNGHELGKCPPVRFKAFSKAERVKQDGLRGKQSRLPRTPGSWPWVLAFCAHAEPRDAALCWFMFRHGYRLTQSIEMTRSKDMDLSAGKVRVHASKGHPAHWVDLDAEEVVMIANLPKPYRGLARDRVFTIAGGRSGALYRRWRATCEAAGIAYLPPHSSGRHGYGTEMIVRQQIDPVSAADNLWANPSVMLKTYSHPEDAAGKVRDAFRVGLEAARTKPVQPEVGGSGKPAERKGKKGMGGRP